MLSFAPQFARGVSNPSGWLALKKGVKLMSRLEVSSGIYKWFPQRVLAGYGLALLLSVPAGVVWVRLDKRTVDGEPVALKPTRFALSIGIYMLTGSAMFRYVRQERSSTFLPNAAVGMMVVGSTVELAGIVGQAARARRSHFNMSTPIDAAIYAVMGPFAVLFIGAVLPLAWEIARRPDDNADPIMVKAIVAGLLATFVVGGGTGALMGRRNVHAVGPEKSRLPLFGWSRTGGDIRAPHFFGIHAMQALPMLAAGSTILSSRRRGPVFAAGALAYGLLTAGLLYQALSGKPAVKA